MHNHKNKITPIGITDYRDIKKIFGIKEKNRRGHIYLIGKTGTGKSTLILNMAISDIRNGNGLALIDPHGDLAEDILDYVPEDRIEDVIYFNPADTDYPIAFNPLENNDPEKNHLAASGLVSVFKKIWADFWGPRTEYILRNAVLALLDNPGSTLLDLPRLLVDKDFRKIIVSKIKNPQVREFWMIEYEGYSKYFRNEAISPIQNKVGQFLTNPVMRNILGQPKIAFDIRNVMDSGKILIANLAKGKIGEDCCSLLGAMLITKIQLAALSRTDIPEDKRRPFYLYIDELQSFVTTSFIDILSEARKYGLNLILAHQYIDQLDEKIRSAILGNVGTIICFRVGANDAHYLAKEFYPVFTEEDLINLPNYHIYLRMMINGKTSRAFSAITLPQPECFVSYKEKIIALSKNRYTRSIVGKRESIPSQQDSAGMKFKQMDLFN